MGTTDSQKPQPDEEQPGSSEKVRLRKQRRRANGEGTIYRRKDGRWAAEITLEDGRRKVFYARKQEDVIAKRDEALYQMRQGILATGRQQKLGTYINWWLEEVKQQRLEKSSYIRYRIALDVHILPHLGQIQLHKLTLQRIQIFYNSKLREGQSASSVQTMHKVIHGSLEYAVKARLLPYNPSTGVSLPATQKRKVRPLTMEQAQHLLHVARGHRLEALVALALATGMRHGEMIALRWEDINFEERSVYVHRNVSYLWKWKDVEGDPKTEAGERTIPLAPGLSAILQVHRKQQHEERRKAGSTWRERDLVFCTQQGNFLKQHTLRNSFYQLLAKAGLPQMHIHDLRHTATNLFRSVGIDIKEVQEILGHSTLEMTLNVYSQVLPYMRKEASEKINRLFQ